MTIIQQEKFLNKKAAMEILEEKIEMNLLQEKIRIIETDKKKKSDQCYA